jgi:hypothetical protein
MKGQYPQCQSVIAPGLSALFNLRFAPDSLCSYEDEILIESSNGSKLIIPIIAKRESPCLSSLLSLCFIIVSQKCLIFVNHLFICYTLTKSWLDYKLWSFIGRPNQRLSFHNRKRRWRWSFYCVSQILMALYQLQSKTFVAAYCTI